jgi:hypothetical protein
MIRILLLSAVALGLSACSEGATVTLPGGGRMSTHRSLWTKSQAVDSTVSGHGYTLSYKTWMLDETVVPGQAIGGWKFAEGIGLGKALSKDTLSGLRAKEVTTRTGITSAADVDKAKIAADVQKTQILNPAE